MTPRRSPLIRSTTRYPLSSIDQGEVVLRALATFRFATGLQVQRAVFISASATPRQARYRAAKCLRRLFDAGLINRVAVFVPSASTGQLSRQLVSTLSPAGARAVGLTPRLARSRSPKPNAVLWHDFWLTEIGVLALEGCPSGLTVSQWWNDRILAARKRQGLLSLPIVPDALLVVRNLESGKDYPCLVELDLGTESVAARGVRADVARKIEGYLSYSDSTFRHEFGLEARPIVLAITDSERRMASLRDLTRRLGGAGRFWFATLPRLRGLEPADESSNAASDALCGPFWSLNWLTAANPATAQPGGPLWGLAGRHLAINHGSAEDPRGEAATQHRSMLCNRGCVHSTAHGDTATVMPDAPAIVPSKMSIHPLVTGSAPWIS